VEKKDNDELFVVIDNNVFISYFWGGITIGTIFDALYDGIFQPIVSDKILAELAGVGVRLKFRKYFTWASFIEVCCELIICHRANKLMVHTSSPYLISYEYPCSVRKSCRFMAKSISLVSRVTTE
jgi:predicted nucleic acid-binding protein